MMAEPKTPEKCSGSTLGAYRAHVFCAHKGGVGKSTLLFHVAAQYAKDHPEEDVLVLDLTATGDISRRFLGGEMGLDQAATSKMKKRNQTAKALMKLLNSDTPAVTPKPSSSTKMSTISRITRRMSIWGTSSARGPVNIADEFGVSVHEHNDHVRKSDIKNLSIIPGGIKNEQPCAALPAQVDIARMAERMREFFQALPGTWRIFIDTDGDLDLTSSSSIALNAAHTCIIPSEVEACDFSRVLSMINTINTIKSEKEHNDGAASIAVLCMTKVDPQGRAGSPITAWEEMNCAVKPHMLVDRSMIERFADTVAAVALETPNIFAHYPETGTDEERRRAFKQGTFVVFAQTKTPGKCASEFGVPLCCLDTTKTYEGVYAN
jgi:cellulose biosynthesis protein BcsQ